ncbi:MAG: hypothetical protein JNM31_10965 [Flavobacteriales bacterium]|nr:hypothetical protein [Flavobacteriales bacterium]
MALKPALARLRKALFGTLFLLLLAELALRAWGMRRYPLYRTDARYEYFTLPDQDCHFGRIRYSTNAEGMRSPKVGPKRRKRVLVVGDSVINGGYQTTQDSLATRRVEREWPDSLGPAPEVINLSAGSWGAGNVAAFLQAHGTFDADLVVAVFSSHDAFDHMTFEPVVGVHPSYPDHKPASAVAFLLRKWFYAHFPPAPPTKERILDHGWQALVLQTRAKELPMVVLLHPERHELAMGAYDDRGRTLRDSLSGWGIPLLPMIGRMDPALYTDRIHLNNAGQHQLAVLLTEVIAAY